MASINVRIEVPSERRAFLAEINTEDDPDVVAQGLARDIGLPEGRYWLKPKGSFVIADSSTLLLVRVPSGTDKSPIKEVEY